MDLIVSWLLFPALLAALWGGWGLLVDRVAGASIPGALVPVVGFGAVVAVGQFTALGSTTAPLTAPLVIALAALGLILGRRRIATIDRGALAAALVVFAVYAAPVVLSGEATIAGFIKLDDTATWLAFSDRIADHGIDLGGLSPSTYEATLEVNIGEGYPIGAFVPFAAAVKTIGYDGAWLIQPYIAALAALLALGLWQLAAPLRKARAFRFAAAAVGAQAALLYGYYLWGGVKEVAAAALIAGAVAAGFAALERADEWKVFAAPVLLAAALVGVLSAGGLIWLAAPAIVLAVLFGRRLGVVRAALRVGVAGLSVALLALPVAVAGALLPETSSPLNDPDARGNLLGALDPAQVAGIWPAGDFRFPVDAELLAFALIAVAIVAAAGAIGWCLRNGQIALAVYALGSLAAAAVLIVAGSPWVEGKALATASVVIPFAAIAAAGLLWQAGRRGEAGFTAVVVIFGVAWSNALAYREVSLAPRAQLAELEHIGELVAGDGPTLVTEYSPYAARHFLREGDPESVSELRRRVIPLRDGSQVPKGDAADTDTLDPAALGAYRTLVIRRSPAASRPPAAYEPLWLGEYYEAWQRAANTPSSASRIGLGDRFDPAAKPNCEEVRELASGAGAGQRVVAATRPAATIVSLADAEYPVSWRVPDQPAAPQPREPGTITANVEQPQRAEYEIWLGGSVRPQVELRIDGEAVDSVRGQLNNLGGQVSLGTAELAAGRHEVEIEFSGADLVPGSAGAAGPVGPLTFDTSETADSELVTVAAPDAARRLCGAEWDWVELSGGP